MESILNAIQIKKLACKIYQMTLNTLITYFLFTIHIAHVLEQNELYLGFNLEI